VIKRWSKLRHWLQLGKWITRYPHPVFCSRESWGMGVASFMPALKCQYDCAPSQSMLCYWVKLRPRCAVFRKTTSGRMFSASWKLVDFCAEIRKHVDSSSYVNSLHYSLSVSLARGLYSCYCEFGCQYWCSLGSFVLKVCVKWDVKRHSLTLAAHHLPHFSLVACHSFCCHAAPFQEVSPVWVAGL